MWMQRGPLSVKLFLFSFHSFIYWVIINLVFFLCIVSLMDKTNTDKNVCVGLGALNISIHTLTLLKYQLTWSVQV